VSATILDGRVVASRILKELKPKVKKLNPRLVVIQVGDDPASEIYIKRKRKACEEINLHCDYKHIPQSTTFDSLIQHIHDLNADSDVSGFIIQLPLPRHLQSKLPQIIREIDPRKDVDGFTAYNLGKAFLSTEFEHLPPATPAGIIALLEHYKIGIKGKHTVIVGHSNIVGKPLAFMLLNRLATVTVCHIETQNLAFHTRQADILISAVGKPGLITADMVKQGAVVIDVGINKVPIRHAEEWNVSKHTPAKPEALQQAQCGTKIVGDVDFEAVKEIASFIAPVPGGVGPMTVASLLRNVVRAKERQGGRV
jgi:methylenetetrahydrofolate dehydrogenase (NADP+)/methenyltetrahydrofolate cyclohydrolase